MDFNWSKEQLDIAREIRSFATNALNEDLYERDQKGEFPFEAWKKCSEIPNQCMDSAFRALYLCVHAAADVYTGNKGFAII